MRILWSTLATLFFIGLAGSSIVVVLFVAELVRTVFRGQESQIDQKVPSS